MRRSRGGRFRRNPELVGCFVAKWFLDHRAAPLKSVLGRQNQEPEAQRRKP